MISLDRGFFGSGSTGDVLARHQKYADLAGHLDVIVFASPRRESKTISENFRVFPTKSSKTQHFVKAVNRAKRLIKENQYDLLVTQEFAAPAGVRIKQQFGLPWIVTSHGMFFSSQWLQMSPVKWYLFYRIRKAVRLADGFRVTNEVMKEKFLEWGVKKPILVEPTPVDVESFLSVQKVRVDLPQILFAGRLSSEKNIAMLVRAVKNLDSKLQLLVVGEGAEQEKLLSEAAQDQRIKFLGPKNHDELREIYKSVDIFVLPSNTETFGKVLIEAGAAGCALVATKTAGAMSIIENGVSGVLVELGDQQGLEEALSKLIEGRQLREKLAQGAREMAKRYNPDDGTHRWVNFWQEIAGK